MNEQLEVHRLTIIKQIIINWCFIIDIMLLVSNLCQVIRFFDYEVDGIIVENKLVCEQPLNNRCSYNTKVRLPDNKIETLKGGFENKDTQIGASIKKRRFSFDYVADNNTVRFPFLWHHLRISLLGLVFILFWSWYRKKYSFSILRQWIGEVLRFQRIKY